MQSPDSHFAALEAILQHHAAQLEAAVRTLQQADETAQWPVPWKQRYNREFAQRFVQPAIFRNWAADAAAWNLLPERQYPNRGNR